MNERAEFLIDTLKKYAEENQTIVRGTDDLSPLEIWLIMRLFASRDSRVLSAVPSEDEIEKMANEKFGNNSATLQYQYWVIGMCDMVKLLKIRGIAG